jgi:hypothetical protein
MEVFAEPNHALVREASLNLRPRARVNYREDTSVTYQVAAVAAPRRRKAATRRGRAQLQQQQQQQQQKEEEATQAYTVTHTNGLKLKFKRSSSSSSSIMAVSPPAHKRACRRSPSPAGPSSLDLSPPRATAEPESDVSEVFSSCCFKSRSM